CIGTRVCKITMSAAKNVTATFNRSTATYLLSVAKTWTGAGIVISSPATFLRSFIHKKPASHRSFL
ncbi:MAG: hypothetical protein LAE24_12255, partial [Candidatus Contendobacter sp.]|nr:hypothetical protein [Candidatus Contendobacter sp.]